MLPAPIYAQSHEPVGPTYLCSCTGGPVRVGRVATAAAAGRAAVALVLSPPRPHRDGLCRRFAHSFRASGFEYYFPLC